MNNFHAYLKGQNVRPFQYHQMLPEARTALLTAYMEDRSPNMSELNRTPPEGEQARQIERASLSRMQALISGPEEEDCARDEAILDTFYSSLFPHHLAEGEIEVRCEKMGLTKGYSPEIGHWVWAIVLAFVVGFVMVIMGILR